MKIALLPRTYLGTWNAAVFGEQQAYQQIIRRFGRGLPALACIGLAVTIWYVFRPGALSLDSVCQIRQAATGTFTDAHPPLMAVLLSEVMRLGGSVSTLVLAQCLLGVLGVYFLVVQLIEGHSREAVSSGLVRWGAVLVILVLLAPISPFAVYLCTFWKDVWVLIAFVWIAGFALTRAGSRGGQALRFAGLIAAMDVALLARHNSVVLLPAFGLVAALAIPAKGRWRRLLAFALPAISFLLLDQAIRNVYAVDRAMLSSRIHVAELTGLCVLQPDLQEELPTFRSMLRHDYQEHHVFGSIPKIYRCFDVQQFLQVMEPSYCRQLEREYWQAAFRHPLLLAEVKARSFLFMLRDNSSPKFCLSIYPNEFHLAHDPRTQVLRNWYGNNLWRSFHDAHLRWYFTRHSLWLVIAGVGCLLTLLRWRSHNLLMVGLVFLICHSYYASYVCAACAGDFRYMYPATLLTQVMTIGLAVGFVAARFKRGRPRLATQGNESGMRPVLAQGDR